jgi:fibronectin type 3 domain-containing protein
MPQKPTGLTATRGEGGYTNSIYLTWTQPNAEWGYIVYRGTNPGSISQVIAAFSSSATNVAYTNTTLTLGLRYYYQVAATNAFGIGTRSDAAYGGTPPLIPTGLAAENGTPNPYVNVSWNSVTGTSVRYLLATNLVDEVLFAGVVTNTSATSFNHYGLTPGRRCYYWIKATNEFGDRGYSASDAGWRNLAPPAAVSATTNLYTNIVVTWTIGDPTNTTQHQVYRSLTDNTNAATLLASALGSAVSYSDNLLASDRGKRYYYWVKARNAYGSSAFSSPSAAGSTPPQPPTGIQASDGFYFDRIRVYWTAAALATSYRVYRSTDNSPLHAALITTVTGTYYDDYAVNSGIYYYYWIRSVNSCGESTWSEYDSGWRDQEKPTPPTQPNPPAVVSASDGTSTNYVSVAWSSVSNASAYEVWRNTEPSSSTASKLVADTTATSYLDANATPGVVYYYWVKSKTTSLTSDFSPYDSGYRAGRSVDIGVSDFVFLPTVLAVGSHPDAVSLRIENYGPEPMTAPNSAWVQCDFYLSVNPVFDEAAAVWLGAYSSSVPLSVRTSAAIILPAAARQTLTIPSLSLGRYYIFVHVRHCLPSTWYDPIPENNTALRLGQTLDIGTAPAAPLVLSDYNGDGRSDLAVYHEPDGCWYIRTLENLHLLYGTSWGATGYVAVVGDYDGDRQSDLAVYNEAGGYWYIRSVAGSILAWRQWWGAPGYQAVPGDYDGDRKADLAVYSEETGNWYIESLSGNRIAWAKYWGSPGYQAVPGDYDGDGISDLAVYHQADGYWYICSLNRGTLAWAQWWGGAGYQAVPGDYDGDGISDLAVYHSYGYWFIQSVSGNRIAWGAYWGAPDYWPVPGDYDGDGIADLAVYNETTGLWYIRTLAGVTLLYGESWGAPAYQPVSSAVNSKQ